MSDWNSYSAGGGGGGGDDMWNDAPSASQGGALDAGDFGSGTNGFGDDTFGGQEAQGGGEALSERLCFNCNKPGHNKADCTEPRGEFSGECRVCQQTGHMAKDCPQKPAEKCRNCHQEGHMAVDCKNARGIDWDGIVDVKNADNAWNKMVQAIEERDMEDLKEGVWQYVKQLKETTYADLESAFRVQGLNCWLIAIEKKSMFATRTNMDLQGNLNKTYTVSYRFEKDAVRPRERELWPKTPEENMERLKDAGEMVSRGLPKCSNCSELGHIKKNCPSEQNESERVVITCFNCGESGHRVRDCPQERVDKFACKNCKKSGHTAKECPEPRVAGPDVECHKCGGTGHFSRDCPEGGGDRPRGCFNCGQEGHGSRDCPEPKKIMCRNCDAEGHRANECPEPRNMEKVQCRNCDEYGHESRQCPKPRDYSRVTCQNCGEKGHTKVRCTQAATPVDNLDSGHADGFGTSGGDDWMASAAADTGGGNNGDAGGWGQASGGDAPDW